MKALSLSQPWASAVVLDEKSIETRSWRTSYRGQIAIHASARFPQSYKDLVDDNPQRLPFVTQVRSHLLPTGSLIGVVTLYDCVPTESVRDDITSIELKFGDYDDGRWAWLLHGAVELPKPVPCKGSLGLWNLKDEEVEAMVAQIGALA